MIWYFPSWNGDFRLVEGDDGDAVLEIDRPTAAEEEILERFLGAAADEGWTDVRAVRLSAIRRRQRVRLNATVAVAGKALLELLKPGPQTLTAVKMEDGTLHVTETAELSLLTSDDQGTKPAKAASVTRPTPSCPSCLPGSVERASEVLLSFLTPAQHAQWAAHRSIDVIGHLSGHHYRIAHRHSALAAWWTHICADLTDGGVLHFHDSSVPPEEEVLAAKLILEHREPWLRNEATCLWFAGHGALYDTVDGGRIVVASFDKTKTDVFKNPFGDSGDGVADTALTEKIGRALLAVVGRTAP